MRSLAIPTIRRRTDVPTFSAQRWRGLLDAQAAPALRYLHFDSCSFGDELVDAIATSPLLRQLRHLTLDDDELSTAGYQRLLERIDAFRHLAILRLPTSTPSWFGARLVDELGPIVIW
jgi:hypothetical protein